MNKIEEKVIEIIELVRNKDEALDGDDVDRLVENIRNIANIHEGNITQKELNLLERYAGN